MVSLPFAKGILDDLWPWSDGLIVKDQFWWPIICVNDLRLCEVRPGTSAPL